MTLSPFRINTCQKHRGRGVDRILFCCPPSHAPRNASIPCLCPQAIAYTSRHHGGVLPRLPSPLPFFSVTSAPLWQSLLFVSIREGFGVYAWDQLQRVFVVDLFQDFVGNLEAVDAPERVAAALILEVFFARFHHVKIPFVFIHILNVFAHHNAYLLIYLA